MDFRIAVLPYLCLGEVLRHTIQQCTECPGSVQYTKWSSTVADRPAACMYSEQ